MKLYTNGQIIQPSEVDFLELEGYEVVKSYSKLNGSNWFKYTAKQQAYTFTTNQGDPDVYVDGVWVGKCVRGGLTWYSAPYKTSVKVSLKNYDINTTEYPDNAEVFPLLYISGSSNDFKSGDVFTQKRNTLATYILSGTCTYDRMVRKNVTEGTLNVNQTFITLNYSSEKVSEYPTEAGKAKSTIIYRSILPTWVFEDKSDDSVYFSLICRTNDAGKRCYFSCQMNFERVGIFNVEFYIEGI